MSNRTGLQRREDGQCAYCLAHLLHSTNRFCGQSCITAWVNKRRTRNVEARFWEYVVKTDKCWLWNGPKRPNGYGRLEVSSQNVVLAPHRFSWELHNGPIPSGLFVCHICDTPACVRPAHLFVGTQLDNMRDRHRKGKYVSGQAWHDMMRRAKEVEVDD